MRGQKFHSQLRCSFSLLFPCTFVWTVESFKSPFFNNLLPPRPLKSTLFISPFTQANRRNQECLSASLIPNGNLQGLNIYLYSLLSIIASCLRIVQVWKRQSCPHSPPSQAEPLCASEACTWNSHLPPTCQAPFLAMLLGLCGTVSSPLVVHRATRKTAL